MAYAMKPLACDPAAGLGLNTGLGDAVDLGWKLDGTLAGWGGPGLLPSYEIERRQVGERNVAASRFATRGRRKWRAAYRPEIRDNTAETPGCGSRSMRTAYLCEPLTVTDATPLLKTESGELAHNVTADTQRASPPYVPSLQRTLVVAPSYCSHHSEASVTPLPSTR